MFSGHHESRVLARSATFVFFIGDRFFGTVTAYVAGPRAAEYHFTSALAAQLFKALAPALQPLLERSVDLAEVRPGPGSPMSMAGEAGAAAPALPAVSAPTTTPDEAPLRLCHLPGGADDLERLRDRLHKAGRPER